MPDAGVLTTTEVGRTVTAENMQGERSIARGPVGWLAVGLHVAVGLFPYLASGLMAPPAGLVVLGVIWIGLFVVVWRWRPNPPLWLLAVPVAALALWFAVMWLGDTLFGWTA